MEIEFVFFLKKKNLWLLDKKGENALYRAAASKHTDVVTHLLKHKVRVDTKDKVNFVFCFFWKVLPLLFKKQNVTLKGGKNVINDRKYDGISWNCFPFNRQWSKCKSFRQSFFYIFYIFIVLEFHLIHFHWYLSLTRQRKLLWSSQLIQDTLKLQNYYSIVVQLLILLIKFFLFLFPFSFSL